MAFTRKFLKELLADHPNRDEMIDQLIELHIQEVSPLKTELDRLKEETGFKTADEIHTEVERITEEIAKIKESGSADVEDWKARYKAVKAEFEAAKAEGDRKAIYEEKAAAFRSMLLKEGVSHSVVDLIVRAGSDMIEGMEMQDGKVRNHESVSAAIRSEYGNFIGKGVPVQSRSAAPTRESIMSITDRTERLAAIQQNKHLFRE